jgi:hypothetical protein
MTPMLRPIIAGGAPIHPLGAGIQARMVPSRLLAIMASSQGLDDRGVDALGFLLRRTGCSTVFSLRSPESWGPATSLRNPRTVWTCHESLRVFHEVTANLPRSCEPGTSRDDLPGRCGSHESARTWHHGQCNPPPVNSLPRVADAHTISPLEARVRADPSRISRLPSQFPA